MVAALARLGAAEAEAALVGAGLLPRCMELFLQYPFNNMLHHQVCPPARQLLMVCPSRDDDKSAVPVVASGQSSTGTQRCWGEARRRICEALPLEVFKMLSSMDSIVCMILLTERRAASGWTSKTNRSGPILSNLVQC